jgi:hypothetical protein
MLLCTVLLMIKFAHRIETKDGWENVFVITNALSVTYAATIVFIFRHLYRFYDWSSNVSMIMLISEDTMTVMNGYIGEKQGIYIIPSRDAGVYATSSTTPSNFSRKEKDTLYDYIGLF